MEFPDTPPPAHIPQVQPGWDRRVELDLSVTTGGGLTGPPKTDPPGLLKVLIRGLGAGEGVYAYYLGRAELFTQPADRPRRLGGFRDDAPSRLAFVGDKNNNQY